MSANAAPFEIAWLKELERRSAAGLAPDNREIMVTLRDILPVGFKPSHVNHRLLNNNAPSVEGLLAIGDETGFVADVERTIKHIRDRLVQYPNLQQVTAGEVAEALGVSPKRAESLLALMASVGNFVAGGSGSNHGYSAVAIGRDEILSEFLAFDGIASLLAKRDQRTAAGQEPLPEAPVREAVPVTAAIRNSVFIIMNMDPADHSLVDVHRTIREVCSEFGLSAVRIDDVEHQGPITERILELIRDAEFIIADLSGERPNSYYEVGYAHAVGKRPILFRKDGTRLHFDLVVHNVPEYRNITELRDMLRRRLENVLGRAPSVSHAT